MNDGRSGTDLSAQGNGVGIPCVPTSCKTKRGLDISEGELRNRTGKREPGCHLTERHHHGENCQTNKTVTEEDGKRATGGESTADTEEETGTDGATKGNELDVSGFEASRNITILLSSLDVAVDVGGFIGLRGGSGLDTKSVIW